MSSLNGMSGTGEVPYFGFIRNQNIHCRGDYLNSLSPSRKIFPETMPDIRESACDIATRELRMNCCPITMNPIYPGEIMVCRVYDPITRVMTRELEAKAYGPILLDQREVVEVHRSWTGRKGVSPLEIHWLGIDTGEICCELRQTGSGCVEFVETRFPLLLPMDYMGERQVRYFHGSDTGREVFLDRIDGAVELAVYESNLEGQDLKSEGQIEGQVLKSITCARLIVSRKKLDREKEGREITIFIALDTGRVVCIRETAAEVLCSIRLVQWII
ncbi:MAG TPA: hypothetical protein PLV45_00675 [bacterium]|nr:hypothetical protein [bacterium]